MSGTATPLFGIIALFMGLLAIKNCPKLTEARFCLGVVQWACPTLWPGHREIFECTVSSTCRRWLSPDLLLVCTFECHGYQSPMKSQFGNV
jgi:hypothetical protein